MSALDDLVGKGLVAPDWASALAPVEDRITAMGRFLRDEIAAGRGYLPAGDRILRAFQRPLASVKVLVVGQDPYPTPGHPVGLSFSVAPDVRPIPRSLANIYQELSTDLGIPPAGHGDLTSWADAGVMLLNRVLTVRPGEPASHRGRGWEPVTERAITSFVERGGPRAAILWGRDAQSLKPMLGDVPWVESAHPSPLSASRGFFGSRPFSRVNTLLQQQGGTPVDWAIPESSMSLVEGGSLYVEVVANDANRRTQMTQLAIEATGLVKSFGKTRAVDGVDLAVRAGSVYGVLGPNGAGKTTTIRMLATLIHPDAGTARVLGHDIVTESDAVRGAVSLTGQLASVDEDLTGRENLILIGRLLGLRRAQARSRADELLDAFGLSPASGRLVKHFSGGMRRRLDIAASIVVTPELMFLDEPTTGLDPRSRNQVWEIIRALVTGGTTILLCTQYLEEADQLADGIAVIDHGKVIAEGTPSQLKASVGSGALQVRLLDPDQRPEAERLLSGDLGSVVLEPDPAALSVMCADADRATDALARLTGSGVRVADFSLGQPSLDEVFLALTGHPAEETPAELYDEPDKERTS